MAIFASVIINSRGASVWGTGASLYSLGWIYIHPYCHILAVHGILLDELCGCLLGSDGTDDVADSVVVRPVLPVADAARSDLPVSH